jgi:hypothetical protein
MTYYGAPSENSLLRRKEEASSSQDQIPKKIFIDIFQLYFDMSVLTILPTFSQ